MHILLQLLGRFLILAAMLYGSYDLYRHFQSGGPWLSSVREFWSEMGPASFSQAEGFFEPHLGMDLWLTIVGVPMIFVIGAIGAIFLLASFALRLRA
jgi:hypothetical protein